MAALPEPRTNVHEIIQEWLMALEYVARTTGQGVGTGDQPDLSGRIPEVE
jgi:hypothetical protein